MCIINPQQKQNNTIMTLIWIIVSLVWRNCLLPQLPDDKGVKYLWNVGKILPGYTRNNLETTISIIGVWERRFIALSAEREPEVSWTVLRVR